MSVSVLFLRHQRMDVEQFIRLAWPRHECNFLFATIKEWMSALFCAWSNHEWYFLFSTIKEWMLSLYLPRLVKPRVLFLRHTLDVEYYFFCLAWPCHESLFIYLFASPGHATNALFFLFSPRLAMPRVLPLLLFFLLPRMAMPRAPFIYLFASSPGHATNAPFLFRRAWPSHESFVFFLFSPRLAMPRVLFSASGAMSFFLLCPAWSFHGCFFLEKINSDLYSLNATNRLFTLHMKNIVHM